MIFRYNIKVLYGEKAIAGAELEIWENPNPEKDYEISISFSEFTCLCPRSGYPDFAVINITYVPDKFIVELKSLKLYLNSFRNTSISHEKASNLIFDTIKEKLSPRYLQVTGDFNPRGNVKTIIKLETPGGRTATP
ncbi:MAG: NADPH-dependent 7-cyano-7-deazaguanine reductase QueF [Nitrospirae bacterium]|nr:NADPH-dependent 7-cyano-7-deazaguanine reductase QueF [Nitrospirota bacterium]